MWMSRHLLTVTVLMFAAGCSIRTEQHANSTTLVLLFRYPVEKTAQAGSVCETLRFAGITPQVPESSRYYQILDSVGEADLARAILKTNKYFLNGDLVLVNGGAR